MKSLKLKSWIVLVGFAFSPLTIYAAVSKDSYSNSLSNKKAYNFISISDVSSSFSDYISPSIFDTLYLTDNLKHENGNIYAASFGNLVPNMVNMINYRSSGNFDYKPQISGLQSVGVVNDSNTFVSLDNAPLTFNSMSEPKAFGMMLAGLGLMAFVARRRKVS